MLEIIFFAIKVCILWLNKQDIGGGVQYYIEEMRAYYTLFCLQ